MTTSGFCYAKPIAVYTNIERQQLEELLAQTTAGELVDFEAVPEGSVNSNYRVQTSRGVYFLRLYEAVGPKEAEAELLLVRSLLKGGVPTPDVIPLREGSLVGEVAERPAALFVFAPGRQLCHRQVTSGHTKSVGTALARMHEIAANTKGLDAGRFTLEHMIRQMRALQPDAALASVMALLVEEAELLDREADDLPSGIIHGDLFRDNVLFEGDRLSALIDFGDVSHGVLAFDLATSLLAWTFYDDYRAGLGRSMVEGYESVRLLTDAERHGGLYWQARQSAFRFTITRISDFHLNPQPPGARKEKDFRRYLARLTRLREIGEKGVEALWL